MLRGLERHVTADDGPGAAALVAPAGRGPVPLARARIRFGRRAPQPSVVLAAAIAAAIAAGLRRGDETKRSTVTLDAHGGRA